MTTLDARLVANLRRQLAVFSVEQLYFVARGLADELTARDLDAALEGRALECALLPAARADHATRLSTLVEPDCLF